MLDSADIVIWDFDGVINRNYDEKGFLWFRDVEADLGISHEALQQALFTGRWAQVLTNQTHVLDLLAEVLLPLGFKGTPREFFDYWMERDFALDREILALMHRIKSIGKKQAIGTNNEPLRTALIWENHGMRDVADHMFSSGLLGVAKPNADYFERVSKILGVRPERILFVEDTPKNVDAARAAGWHTVAYGDSSKMQLGNARELSNLLGMRV
ncbi:MAG: HAD-IA family hydrolase [Alphaproteobacteria bacterium]